MGSSTQLLGAELQISYKKKILRYWLKATTLYTNFVCVYRPPLSRKNKLTDAMFHDEFPDLLDFCNNLSDKCVILGDMNVHVDSPKNLRTAKLFS